MNNGFSVRCVKDDTPFNPKIKLTDANKKPIANKKVMVYVDMDKTEYLNIGREIGPITTNGNGEFKVSDFNNGKEFEIN